LNEKIVELESKPIIVTPPPPVQPPLNHLQSGTDTRPRLETVNLNDQIKNMKKKIFKKLKSTIISHYQSPQHSSKSSQLVYKKNLEHCI